jgi:hypothetical protein
VYVAWYLPLMLGYARPLYLEIYEPELGFGIEKLGAAYVYPCPNISAVVYYGILKVGAEPSMVVRLWKWFTG